MLTKWRGIIAEVLLESRAFNRKVLVMRQEMLDRMRVVLVHTSHPGNIGGVARAMKNMGLSQLYLVKPRKYPHEEATWRAANASDLLDSAIVVETVEEAIADCQLVVGTSARERRIPWPLLDPRATAERVSANDVDGNVALLFGREDRGLTNEELQMCNVHVHIPTNPDYSSLNLAAAVQVICYELRMAAMQERVRVASDENWDMPLARAEDVGRLFTHLEEVLLRMSFMDKDNPKQVMTRLRRLFNRAAMDKMEVNILRGILAQVEKHLDKVE